LPIEHRFTAAAVKDPLGKDRDLDQQGTEGEGQTTIRRRATVRDHCLVADGPVCGPAEVLFAGGRDGSADSGPLPRRCRWSL